MPCLLAALVLLPLIGPESTAAAGIDIDKRSIAFAMRQEPPDLNTTTSTDAQSHIILDHIMEGLLTADKDNNLVGGVAERWELREDGATFWLRKDARWSNGDPVTAHDFVFSWRKVLDPATASEYAFVMYPVLNAEAINNGDKPVESLGVEAIDDLTLEVSFRQPVPYFLGLTAFTLLFPVQEAFYNSRGGRYGADVADMIFNGPFVLNEWVHGASLSLEKNPRYWNKSAIWLNHIEMPYITEDATARLNLYRDNKIALADELVEESMGGALQERMQIKTFLDGAIFYVEFNHRSSRLTRNKNLRKAIQSVVNTDDLVYKILGNPGTYPSYGLYPRWIKGLESQFVREFPPPRAELSIEKGREYLKKAMEELGVDKLPPINVLADDSPNGKKSAEYLQTLLTQTLGLEIRVDIQIFKQRLAKSMAGEFDMFVSGWGPDYDDILTYADLFHSDNRNNRGRFKNYHYDELVKVAQSSIDLKTRMQAFADMQDILFEDVVIVPLFERGKIFVQHPQLKGVIRRAVGGDPNFNYAEILPAQGEQP